MKKNLPLILMLLYIVTLMSACTTVKKTQADRTSTFKNAKENTADCFVQKADGSIEHYTSLQLVTGMFITPHLLANGNIKIYGAAIKAYQNKDHYAIWPGNIERGRRSKVAVETLPGFAVRIAKGNLNVYCKKYFNGTKAVDELFIQSGTEGKIIAYTPELLTELVKNHPEVVDFLNSKKKINPVSKKLQAVAEIYNRPQLMTKN